MNKYTQHTPGPWIINSIGQVTDLQDRTIVPNVHAHNVPSNAFPRGSGQYVAEDDGGVANARLIAAAPDLLDALEEAIEVVGSWGDDGDPSWLERAKSAIAKVGGAA